VSSFGGFPFTALEDGWSEPATSAVNVRGFPGGNSIAISLGGQREVTRTVTCLFADRGTYINFVLLRGKDGNSLTIDDWDTVEAILKEANADPPRLDGTIQARAQFVLK
jgi:hypothetical protein